jgi:hypothetical protein
MRLIRSNRTRIVPAAACLALVGMAGLVPAPAAAVAASAPAPYPLTAHLHVGDASRMLDANGHLFVAEGEFGSTVHVYSTTGVLLHTIPDESGAAGMAVSADGSTLYVADSTGDSISAINTTTYAHQEFTVEGCPTYLALASGRLFYSFGCASAPDSSGVANISPATGGTPVANFTHLNLPPLLAGAGSVLAVADQNLEPAHVSTYSAATSGALTAKATMSFIAPPSDLALSADGATLATAGGGGDDYIEYSTATFKQKAEFTTGSKPITVALSPDGTHVVGGLDGADDLVNLYAGSAGAPVWQRFGATSSPNTWTAGTDDQILPGSLTFSPDGSNVYGLVHQAASNGVALFASSITTSTTSDQLTIKNATFGHSVTASMRLSGRGQVVFKATSNGAMTQLGTAATDSNGVAKVTFKSTYGGSVQAIFEGSTTNYPVAAKQPFKIAAKTQLTLSGSYAKRHGLQLFRHAGKVRIVGAVLPAIDNRRVTGSVEDRHHGKWHSLGTLVAHVGKKGIVRFGLPFSVSHVPERVTLTFAGDARNAKSQTKSPRFEIT